MRLHEKMDLGSPRTAGINAAATGLVLLTCALCSGCDWSDGSTLDEHGRPYKYPFAPGIGSKYGAADFPPTFGGVSADFFQQFCASCHGGVSPSKGLDLSQDEAHEQLVDVPAVQRSEFDRVTPGDSDNSYLIIKLEGGPDMAGSRMPRGAPARPQEEIDTIRMWIDEGALYD